MVGGSVCVYKFVVDAYSYVLKNVRPVKARVQSLKPPASPFTEASKIFFWLWFDSLLHQPDFVCQSWTNI